MRDEIENLKANARDAINDPMIMMLSGFGWQNLVRRLLASVEQLQGQLDAAHALSAEPAKPDARVCRQELVNALTALHPDVASYVARLCVDALDAYLDARGK